MESTTMKPFAVGLLEIELKVTSYIYCRIMAADIEIIDIFHRRFLNVPKLHKAVVDILRCL